MQKLAELCVRRPVFASVLVLILIVVGTFSYRSLGVDRFPNVDFPAVTISTVLIGAAPEEIETEITDKIEEAVNTISGIDQLISVSSEGTSVVTIQFDLEKDTDVAAQEVRDRVNTILRDLPGDADPPIISKIDPDATPVLSLSLAGPASAREITEYADKLFRRRLESVLGVGQVLLVGGQPRQINIVVDTAKLSAQGLTPAQVVSALRSQNVQLPGGRVEQGNRELTLRTYGRVETTEELGEIPVALRDGVPVRIRDVARVEDSVADPESVASVNGEPAVVLQVRKQSGTNTIAVVERLKERLAVLEADLPAGWKVQVIRDQSTYVVNAIHAVQEHLVLGSLLAVIIVWIFLRRFRPTLIAAVAIPASLISTFGVMAYFGFTLNVITLLALTLSVGIVIDDAVVVLENIFRVMEEGPSTGKLDQPQSGAHLTPAEAAVIGTREVGLAVLATSLSLIAVFLPVVFMGGIVGRFMSSFGVTMAAAVAVSLIVSFTLTPMMASRWLKPSDIVSGTTSRDKGFYRVVERFYMGLLGWSMRHRWVIVLAMLLVFLSAVPLAKAVNKNFIPVDDEAQFQINVRTQEGTDLESAGRILRSIAGQVRDWPEVRTTLVTSGADPQHTRNAGEIYVALTDAKERKLSQSAVMNRVRGEILPQYAGLNLRVQVVRVNAFSGASTADVMFWLGGPDLDQLGIYADDLITKAKEIPGIADIDTNLIVGKPELGIHVDRAKAADLGVRVEDIATTLNLLVGGQEVSDYYEDGEQYEVHVRARPSDRADAQAILLAEVPSSRGGVVRLGDVVTAEEGSGPSLVNRISRRRQVLISANMLPGYSSQAVIDSIQKHAAELNMSSAYSYGFAGRSREQVRAGRSFLTAFVLSVLFMYLILAAQFESWIHPITILMALPMTVPFALLSILALNESLNLYSSLGMLVLFGIVKKNGILQVDHTNQLRAKGMERLPAILQANRDRLRPILMTTLAFVAGMIPLVVSSGTGAATNRTIGSVIIGGQSLALLLTLLGVPVWYSIFDDWSNSRLVRKLLGRRQNVEEVAVELDALEAEAN